MNVDTQTHTQRSLSLSLSVVYARDSLSSLLKDVSALSKLYQVTVVSKEVVTGPNPIPTDEATFMLALKLPMIQDQIYQGLRAKTTKDSGPKLAVSLKPRSALTMQSRQQNKETPGPRKTKLKQPLILKP